MIERHVVGDVVGRGGTGFAARHGVQIHRQPQRRGQRKQPVILAPEILSAAADRKDRSAA